LIRRPKGEGRLSAGHAVKGLEQKQKKPRNGENPGGYSGNTARHSIGGFQ
jgi:hypothetical protein